MGTANSKKGKNRSYEFVKDNTDFVVALAGNPNVGKSTVFNELTGLKQHTGNWAGKTVDSASGSYYYKHHNYAVVDLPGTYSLLAHSPEEEVARDFICFEGIDALVVVCDATCLERNLNLVLQTIEMTSNVVLCLNLMDEAHKKKIFIDQKKLALELGVPVVQTTARSGRGMNNLLEEVHLIVHSENVPCPVKLRYSDAIESAAALLEQKLCGILPDSVSTRFVALRLIENDESMCSSLNALLGYDIREHQHLKPVLAQVQKQLEASGSFVEEHKDSIVQTIAAKARSIAGKCVTIDLEKSHQTDRRLDKIFTSKLTGVPIMLLLLFFIFWLTIYFSNYPSELLRSFMTFVEGKLWQFSSFLNVPQLISQPLIDGVFRVLGWVVAVMLPPMAIFFPLFTLLEDFGYLPRVAFNLDNVFRKCDTCGKQALTTCMGFGCNAVGVTGARIIDSPRERLIAIITNSFTPCNGRFPMLIAIITMFFASGSGAGAAFLPSVLMTLLIIFSFLMTFAASKLLSKTLLKGQPSSFTLELPPYRKPQIGKVLVRSLLDRTLFVLGRAASVAAPAGLVIWMLSNIMYNDISLLNHAAAFLDPFAKLFGMDGVILIAFILGFPANEIVVPIMLMAYMNSGSLVDYESLASLKEVLVANGWTAVTAINVLLFSLMHWPCSTTCLTIKKETKSIKWTAVSFLLPTVCGFAICFLFTWFANLVF